MPTLGIVRDRFIRFLSGVIVEIRWDREESGLIIESITLKDTKASRSVSDHPRRREMLSTCQRRWRDRQVISQVFLKDLTQFGATIKVS